MERPLAYIGFSYLLGLLVAFFTANSVIFVISTLCFIIFVVLCAIKHGNKRLLLSLFGVILAGAVMLIYDVLAVNDYSDYDGETHEISAYLAETVNYSDSYTAYKAVVFSVDNSEVEPFTVYLYSYLELMYDSYDIVTGTVTFEEFADDDGLSSYKNYMIADGYMLVASLDLNEYYTISENTEFSFAKLTSKLRCDIKIKINSLYFETNANLLEAMLIGYNLNLDDDLYNDFIYAGANHLLVVSGLHLSIIGGALYLILNKLNLRYYVIPIIILPVIITYMFVAGFGISIFRSGIMFIIVMIANVLGEENEPINSLGLAVLIICLANPYSCVDIGFLLSVTGTAGILILAPKIIEYFMDKVFKTNNKKVFAVVSLVTVAVSAFLFLMPLLLVFFEKLNPISILSSVILTPIATVFMYTGIISILISSIPVLNLVTFLAVLITNVLGNIITSLVSIISPLGMVLPNITEGRNVILASVIIVSCAVAFLYKPTKKVKITLFCTVLVMIIVTFISQHISMQSPRILVANSSGEMMVCVMFAGETTVITYDGNSIESDLGDFGIYNYEMFDLENEVVIYDDFIVNSYLENQLISIEYNDTIIMIELASIDITEMHADILITNQNTGSISSAFTFLYNSDTIRDNSDETVILDYTSYVIIFDDEISIRRIE